MIFTNSWLYFFPSHVAAGGGAITVTAACGTSSTATTSGMTALVSQVAAASAVTVTAAANRLAVTATFGPGAAYTANEYGLFINAAMARWAGPPTGKLTDETFLVDFAIDCEEGV